MKTQMSSLIPEEALIPEEDWVEVRSIGGERKVIGQLHIEIWMAGFTLSGHIRNGEVSALWLLSPRPFDDFGDRFLAYCNDAQGGTS